ncbi:MAG: BlaI/MecI/CopY family transcriptional regulator [Myxococcales bacterium]|nr:BlaI/MecI/CopY family transcriptional regulator [Myxococcales bacterium]MCB9717535.1 BlaI/MecI/CopY family transcriptional regulator [Myxococcales bacterium]
MDVPPQLSDQQLAFMRVLWDRGEATAQDVHAELSEQGMTLAPTTVATVLTRLERRGLVSHRRRGRQYVYRARAGEQEVRRSMLARLTDFFFGGDPQALVSHLTAGQGLGRDDLEEVRRLIAEKEAARESDDDGS